MNERCAEIIKKYGSEPIKDPCFLVTGGILNYVNDYKPDENLKSCTYAEFIELMSSPKRKPPISIDEVSIPDNAL